ncbi:MAG: methyltransferase domain-containing protein [Patescibacteria group bacterium]
MVKKVKSMNKTSNWDENYYTYLTEKVDRGVSINPVINKTCDIIKNNFSKLDTIRILDMGCFTGSVLHQIYKNSSPRIKSKLILVGLDVEEEALKRGSEKFQNITYVKEDFFQTQESLVHQYDIVILSNVLHEIFSDELIQSKKSSYSRVNDVIRYASRLIKSNGALIILDGFMPEKSKKMIKIEFKNENYANKFKQFLKSYKAFDLRGEFTSKTEVITNVATSAVFLAKYRYIDTTYWKSEAKQLYQFIKIKKMKSILKQNDFYNTQFELQHFNDDVFKSMFDSLPREEDFPMKNVLITSFKDPINFLS